MRLLTSWMALSVLLAGSAAAAYAGGPDSRDAIQKRLLSEYALTKPTDDKTDIVTAGAVLVLQKDRLMMLVASSPNPCANTYRDGKLSPNGACQTGDVARKIGSFFGHKGPDQAPNTRYFVTGEKFWVTEIDVKDAGKDSAVVMQFFSDAINDTRFTASLAIAFPRGLPSADEVLQRVEEVVKVQPSDNDGDNGGQSGQGSTAQAPPAAPPPPPQAEAAPPPIAPPPPPPDQPPPTVSLGETPVQVVAILGEPQHKAKVGVKEIYSYKDLKVTFVNGKVKDIQ